MGRKLIMGIVVAAMALYSSLAFGYSTLTYNEFIGFTPTGSLNGEGLGTISQVYGEGNHNARVFFDYDIDLDVNNEATGFWPEFLSSNLTALEMPQGLTWEANFAPYPSVPGSGDIYDNFLADSLQNTTNLLDIIPDDVAFAMGRLFTVGAGWEAVLSFTATENLAGITPDFYLTQTDDLSGNSLYFYSTLTFRETGVGPEPVPEPSTFVLLGSALAGLGIYARRRRNS